MASNKTNRVEVPEAKAAMDRFKTEVSFSSRKRFRLKHIL